MSEVILARHGETDWNAAEIFRGRFDVALNETGEKQAESLGKYLSKIDINAIYSSPLKRALKTAEAIASYHSLGVHVARGLIDFDFGEWQGLSHNEVRERYPELYARWLDHPEQVVMPGGEGLEDVKRRVMAVAHRVIGTLRGGVAVLVSHRVVNKVLICAMLGLDNSHFWNVRMDACGLTIFSYRGGKFILNRHNDTSFLNPVKTAALADF
ncbi:MAG: hypothetical protein A2144_13400 [Chloroflexi bacterium RBG_16_50_9]|nr:MAG: hypothetical protein A2144_13400 [Chloroflexi bacterium RBG_16_50_9]